jgi:hypothetical protein
LVDLSAKERGCDGTKGGGGEAEQNSEDGRRYPDTTHNTLTMRVVCHCVTGSGESLNESECCGFVCMSSGHGVSVVARDRVKRNASQWTH